MRVKKKPNPYEQLNGNPPVKTEPPSPTPNLVLQGDLLNNELVKTFMQKFGITLLTGEIMKALSEQVKYRTEDGGMATYPGGLLWLCETQIGFMEFAKARFDQLLAFPNPVKPVDALKNLRNVAKRRGEDGKGLPGWLQWKQENPALCTAVKQEVQSVPLLTANEIGFGYHPDELTEMGTLQ